MPISFRFAGSKGYGYYILYSYLYADLAFSHALAVQKLLKERYIPQISNISHHDGTSVNPPKPIPWYPDELAWSMATSKSVVRRFPPFASFQKYLVSETSVGNISRQEVVSMIPPLVMDLEPGMIVLDMCAAPGSKAAQMLEMIHTGEEMRMRRSLRDFAKIDGRDVSPDIEDSGENDPNIDTSDFGRATGLLIANDSDCKRSHMLIHQLKRLSSPNLIVTNHDATIYPSIKLPPSAQNSSSNKYLKFDRILADVPCSGDGTTRKNLNLWKDWKPASAIGLHSTQVRILIRALQMLKVGGRVVYSTCSMNPVENEAVISSAITRSGGLSKVKLLSCDEKIPLLKRRPGLKDWAVMDKSGKIWKSWDEVTAFNEEHRNASSTDKLIPGMFPPAADSPEAQIPFQNCMRVYAHLQDTGGFFIAVLEKQSEFKNIPEPENTPIKPPTNSIFNPIEITSSPEGPSSITFPLDVQNSRIITNDGSKTDCGTKRPVDVIDIENLNHSQCKKSKVTECSGAIIPEESEQPKISPAAYPIVKGLQDSKEVQKSNRPNRNRHGAVEEPFKYISNHHPEIKAIELFYQLSPHFPRDRFMVRNATGDLAKTIYYTSALVRDILTENEGHGIKFIHGGVRMFVKQEVEGPDVCRWRIQSEGMPIIEGYVGEKRVVHLTKKETLRKLLIEMFPKLADEAWKELGEIGEQIKDIGTGCLVLRINPSPEKDAINERIVLPLWRGTASINLMMAKEDRTAMLRRMFDDDTPLVNHSKEAKVEATEENSTLHKSCDNEDTDENSENS